MAREAIFQAAASSRPGSRGMAGPELIACVNVSKYCNWIPMYRQSDIYVRDSVQIDSESAPMLKCEFSTANTRTLSSL